MTVSLLLELAVGLHPERVSVGRGKEALTEASSTVAILDADTHRQALASQDPRSRAPLVHRRFIPDVEGLVPDEPRGAQLG